MTARSAAAAPEVQSSSPGQEHAAASEVPGAQEADRGQDCSSSSSGRLSMAEVAARFQVSTAASLPPASC